MDYNMDFQNLTSSGMNFIGTRTKYIEEMKRFAVQVLGYKKTHETDTFVAFTTPQGQRFELFREDEADKQHFPLGVPVPGFEVPDFDAAVMWLNANNLEIFGGIGEGESGTRWAHFCGPDGNIYEFVYHPPLGGETDKMNLYRFSPIQNKEELLEAIKYVHLACNKLCKQSFGEYLPNAGNLGIFCHYDDEYDRLITLRKEMTEESDNTNQKYFRLHEPIIIPAQDDIPETTYTHLYIRKPDPYRHHVGDVDFSLPSEEHKQLKQAMQNGKVIKGARIFPRQDLDMIELYDPDIDACGYVSTEKMAATAHVKQSEETNL